jgi:hypothetical protein
MIMRQPRKTNSSGNENLKKEEENTKAETNNLAEGE